jgi:hypothetical protein
MPVVRYAGAKKEIRVNLGLSSSQVDSVLSADWRRPARRNQCTSLSGALSEKMWVRQFSTKVKRISPCNQRGDCEMLPL